MFLSDNTKVDRVSAKKNSFFLFRLIFLNLEYASKIKTI